MLSCCRALRLPSLIFAGCLIALVIALFYIYSQHQLVVSPIPRHNWPIARDEGRYDTWQAQIPATLAATDYCSVIVKSEQKNYLFYQGQLLLVTPISTGSQTRFKEDRTLRSGTWRLSAKVSQNLSALYGPRLIRMEYYNPQQEKFIKTNKAFHGTDEPEKLGQPTSMGCVYHHNNMIIYLYELLPIGTLIMVTDI